MNTIVSEDRTERNPWSGVWMTLLLPGLGHVYCGALLRGLVFMAASVLAAILVVVAGLREGTSASFWFGILCFVVLGVMTVAIVDTWRLARRTRADYRLKDYNRWQVYVLLLIISSGGGIGFALYVRESVVQAFVLPNNSMYPSIRQGDRILVTKRDYLERDPEQGEVVVFRNPENRRQHWVKRIVAVEGETVEIRAGELFVNGEKQVYETDGVAAEDVGPVEVLKNHVYVLGDNRANSRDSRHFGPVPVASLVGKVAWIVFPGEDWSRLGSVE